MDADRFATFFRSLASAPPRRSALRLLAALVLGSPLALGHLGAAAHDKTDKCKKIDDDDKKKKCLKKAKKHKRHHRQASAPPTPVLTYECPGPHESIADVPDDGTTRVAQTFTAAQSGSLLQIQFEVDKSATGDFVVDLLAVGADGKPTNTILAQVIIPHASVPNGFVTLVATFSGPPLAAGTQYAAAISRPEGGHWRIKGRVGNDCAGTMFTQTPKGSGVFNEFFGGDDDLVTSVTVLA